MDILREFYESNAEWINYAASALVGAFVAWLTSLFRTRSARLEDLIDGKNVYDDTDLVVIDHDCKRGDLLVLGECSVVKKGKNADHVKEN